jgi:hypothetical protein
MRRGGRILLLVTVALVLVPSGAADAKKHKPKMTQCGAYSAADGSLAAQLVQSIAVSKGTSCSTGQSVASAYAGQMGRFKASSWRCRSAPNVPPRASTIGCTRGSGVISYTLAVATDCSSTPGADERDGSGPYVFNIDCASAVPVYNNWVSSAGNNKPPPGWTCTTQTVYANKNDQSGDTWFSCVMKTGSATQVVQGNATNDY